MPQTQTRKVMLEYFTKINGKKNRGNRSMTMARTFQQFFTPPKYSQVMINALHIQQPKKIIDLAMGEGSLLLEAMRRWESSLIYGNDIDPNCCRKIIQEHSNISCHDHDIFLNASLDKLLQSIGKVDLCVANPPFHSIKQNEDIRILLKEFSLDEIYQSEYIPSEVPFILQNFKILEKFGTLAIILPDGFFTNKKLKHFRQFLISNFLIEKVIELPKKIFKNTHAKTHILILRNEAPVSQTITLTQHIKSVPIAISSSDAIERMDYSYYSQQLDDKNTTSISELDVTFLRGKSRYLLKEVNSQHILHTTSFRHGTLLSNRLKTKKKLKEFSNHITEHGDIVIARVGTSCLGNIGMVQSGYFIATDCIIIIRTKNLKLRDIIYNALISQQGQQWIKANSKGVAARHITLEAIKKFPITL
ncbi:MAG: N-6 DNA methylase [Sulfurovum sp.]|nr:N-6 DNA methylase [Sulfurovum sp.]